METNTTLILALGSNVDAENNMEKAQEMLQHLFQDVDFTTSIWTDPINIESGKFLNCLALTRSMHNTKQLVLALKQIEKKCGDTKPKRRMNHIRMDIDILEYKGVRYHEKDWSRPYIQELLAEFGIKSEDLNNQE